MAQLLQTKDKAEADELTVVLDYEGFHFWISRRRRSMGHVPGPMLYVVHVRERDFAQAREIKSRHLIGRNR